MSAVAALLLALIGTDRLGDPLLPGVTARYGTNRLCGGSHPLIARLRFHPVRDEVYLIPNRRAREQNVSPIGWSLPSGAICYREPAGQGAVFDLLFDPTGQSRLMMRRDAEIWDHATGRRVRSMELSNVSNNAVEVCGFRDNAVAVITSPSSGPAPLGELRVIRSGQARTGAMPICRVPAGSACTLPAGNHVWIADQERDSVRKYHTDTGALVSWQRLTAEPDTDLDVFTHRTSDDRRLIAIQTRQHHKTDRYRGHPECFVQVFDTVTNRVESRYAFRLDDIGLVERLKPSEEGDGGYEFVGFTPSDDGQFLVWVDHSRHCRIRHLPSGRVVTVPGEYIGLESLAFCPNGKRLAILDSDRIIRLIDPCTGRFQITADSPPTAAKQAAVSPDGKLVATGHGCGEVWVWDAATGKPLWHTEADGEPIRELHFNPTGTTVSAVGFWGPAGVRTFDAKSGKELGPMLPYRYLRTIAVSADGKRIVDLIEEKSVMEKGEWAYPLFARTREVSTGKELNRVRLDHRLGLPNETSGVISRDGRVMVVTHTDGSTFAYDTATGKRLAEFDQPKRGPSPKWTVGEDGRMVIHTVHTLIGGPPLSSRISGRTATVYDLTSQQPGKPIRVIDTGSAFGHSGLAPDGRYLMLSREVYDIRTCELVRDLPIGITAFFPDGKSVLTLPGIRGAERVSLEPLAWKVAPPPKPTGARLKELWKQLGEPAALDAVFELARHPTEVPFLKTKLLTDPPDAKAVAGHIEKLGSKLFAERDVATKALRELGPEVLPALRAALKADPSPEARSRLEKLLPVLADTAAPFTLARLRALEALERCATPDARAVLDEVAKRPGTPWADDAVRALTRSTK